MTFKSTAVKQVKDNQYVVEGEMTIKDVTREIVFDVADEGRGQDPWGNQRWGISAETKLNRKDFGLTWNAVTEAGSIVVSDKVKLDLNIQLILK